MLATAIEETLAMVATVQQAHASIAAAGELPSDLRNLTVTSATEFLNEQVWGSTAHGAPSWPAVARQLKPTRPVERRRTRALCLAPEHHSRRGGRGDGRPDGARRGRRGATDRGREVCCTPASGPWHPESPGGPRLAELPLTERAGAGWVGLRCLSCARRPVPLRSTPGCWPRRSASPTRTQHAIGRWTTSLRSTPSAQPRIDARAVLTHARSTRGPQRFFFGGATGWRRWPP